MFPYAIIIILLVAIVLYYCRSSLCLSLPRPSYYMYRAQRHQSAAAGPRSKGTGNLSLFSCPGNMNMNNMIGSRGMAHSDVRMANINHRIQHPFNAATTITYRVPTSTTYMLSFCYCTPTNILLTTSEHDGRPRRRIKRYILLNDEQPATKFISPTSFQQSKTKSSDDPQPISC